MLFTLKCFFKIVLPDSNCNIVLEIKIKWIKIIDQSILCQLSTSSRGLVSLCSCLQVKVRGHPGQEDICNDQKWKTQNANGYNSWRLNSLFKFENVAGRDGFTRVSNHNFWKVIGQLRDLRTKREMFPMLNSVSLILLEFGDKLGVSEDSSSQGSERRT